MHTIVLVVNQIAHLVFFIGLLFFPVHLFIAFTSGLFSSFYYRGACLLHFQIKNRQMQGVNFNKVPPKNKIYPAAFLLKATFSFLKFIQPFFGSCNMIRHHIVAEVCINVRFGVIMRNFSNLETRKLFDLQIFEVIGAYGNLA